MKGAFLPIASVVLMLPVAALASSKTYTVQPFESISVASDIALKAKIGPEQSVTAKVAGGNFEDLLVGVQNGRLTIAQREHPFRLGGNDHSYRMTVTVPALHSLAVSSSGRLAVSGLKSDDLSIAATSSGRVEAEGTCGTLAVTVSGSGRVDASDLHCADVKAQVSNSGRIAVYASDSFSGRASDGGRIEVSGKPQTVDVDHASDGAIDIAD